MSSMQPIVPPEVSNELAQILSNLVLGDNEIRKSAEQAVDERLQQTPELYLLALAQFARMADTHVMRSFSLVLLRRLLFRPMPFAQGVPRQVLYDHLSEQTRDTLERVMLSCLQNEPDDGVRKKVADTITDLAKGSLERGRPWEALQVQTFTATRSPNPGHREAAYRIFTYVPQLALNQEMNAVIDVFDRGLQDPESLQVRLSALRAATNYLSAADAETKARAGRLMVLMLDTLPPLPPSHLPPFINAVIALASTDPALFAPHLKALLNFLPPLILPSANESQPTPTSSHPFPPPVAGQMVAEPKDEDKELTRKAAVELMVTLSESKASMVKRVDGWAQILVRACLEGMGEIEDDPDWENMEPSEETVEADYQVYEQALDRVAIALGGKPVLPVAFQFIPAMLQSHDWKHRHAGLIAVASLAEGTASMLVNELAKIVQLVCPLFQDAHPRVRWAACQCIGQLCSDLEDAIQDTYHSQVLAALIPTLEAPEPRVHSHAAAALINFCEGVEPETLKPYLELLIPRLLRLIAPGNKRYVQEQAITTLAMVADASEAVFAQYYSTFMPLLFDILRNATGPEHIKLRCKAMECGGLIAIAVGRDVFRPDSQQFIELLLSIQNSNQGQDAQLATYMTATWGKLCQALGPEFAQILPVVMPGLLHQASAKADVEFVSDNETDRQKYTEDNGWEVLSMDGQEVAIRTSLIEDKLHALEMLVVHCSTLGAKFQPYIAPTLEIALPGLRFYFHDGVREACAMLLPLLLASAKQSDSLSPEIARAVLTTVGAGIVQETDTSFLMSLYKCFTDAVKVLGGTQVVDPELGESILKATQNHLQVIAQKRKARRPDEDELTDLAYVEENEDYALDEMAKMLKYIFDPNHPLIIAVASVKDLGQRQHWEAAANGN